MENLENVKDLNQPEEITNIAEVMNNCCHIGVILNECYTKCLKCKKKLTDEECEKVSSDGLLIYAVNYVTKFSLDDRLDIIQSMYEGLQRLYPQKADKELVSMIQIMINNECYDKQSEELNNKNFQK